MNSTADKKEFFYVVVLILTFITVLVGATFAIYALIHKQEEGTSAVYTGTFSIEYLSGDIIDFHLLTPIVEPSIDTVNNVYRNNFRVKNTGSLDSLISVMIEVNKNEFSSETLMYALYDSEEKVIASGFLEGSKDILLSGDIILTNGETEDFVLLVWLKESGVEQNSEMRKSFTGQIVVDAAQKLD